MNEQKPSEIAAELLMSNAERQTRDENPSVTMRLNTTLTHAYSLVLDNENDLKDLKVLLDKAEKILGVKPKEAPRRFFL